MKLSIITINYNEAAGLARTIRSVQEQTYADYEHIIVDGGSRDDSVAVIRRYSAENDAVSWLSEPDHGIYDAMNKGIRMATGDYCFFLNSGDVFASKHMLEQVFAEYRAEADIVYGNLICVVQGKRVDYCRGVSQPTFLDLYHSCMKHQASFIRRSLFQRYGTYDDKLQIVADWEWFFRVIGFHDDVSLQYFNLDIAEFDNEGISSRSPELSLMERQMVLNRYMSRRQEVDYQLLSKYRNIRYIDGHPLLMFCQRVVGKIGKIVFNRHK